MHDQALIEQLLANLAAGRIEPGTALPVLGTLAAPDVPQASLAKLLKLLEERNGAPFDELRNQLHARQYEQAARAFHCKAYNQPVPADCLRDLEDLPVSVKTGWLTAATRSQLLDKALNMIRDWGFSLTHQPHAPQLPAAIEAQLNDLIRQLNSTPGIWSLFSADPAFAAVEEAVRHEAPALLASIAGMKKTLATEQTRGQSIQWSDLMSSAELPQGIDELHCLTVLQTRFSNAQSRTEKQSILDRICTWPTDSAAPFILKMADEPWAGRRISLIMALRFEQKGSASAQLPYRPELQQATEARYDLENPAVASPFEFLLLRLLAAGSREFQQLRNFFVQQICKLNIHIVPEDFVNRWTQLLSTSELNAIVNSDPALPAPAEYAVRPPPVPPPLPPLPVKPPVPPAPAVPLEPEPPPAPREPTAWEKHFKPFFVENWYIVVGLMMVVVGSSLLAYYTWDKSWVIRFTLMPLILAFFTAALAETGRLIERMDASLKGTGTMLRVGAIALLPLNFMTVALLSGDPDVPAPGTVVPLLVLAYAVFAGWGLQRWCAAVDSRLRWRLGIPLLLLNVLSAVRPLTGIWFNLSAPALNVVTMAGVYAGFVVIAAAMTDLTRRILNSELVADRRISWFFGGALALSFLEVFAWTHIWSRTLPPLAWCAPLVVLGGGLVLLVERRILQLRGVASLSSESFLGFAMIMLGILLGAAHPEIRIFNFIMGGAIWIHQAVPRRAVLDYWIGMVLLALGLASAGLLPVFPGARLAELAIAIVLLTGFLGSLAKAEKYKELKAAAFDFQMAALFLSAPVTVLARWHFQSSPVNAAVCIAVIAALFMWRGFRDRKVRYVHVSMTVLALTLPYLGCVDLREHMLRGNSMVFGLALLSLGWLAVMRLNIPLLREARSSVLFVYGLTAACAMILRVLVEGQLPLVLDWRVQYMDYTGPILMTGILIATAWYSRSLLPAGLAALIMVVLLPEMKESISRSLPWVSFGTGRGSAVSALALTLLCFVLRRSTFLKDPGPGDGFFNSPKFPLCRYNHSLFTLPLMASVLFLLMKLNTWVLVNNLPHVGVAASTALGLSGVTWILVAVYFRSRRYTTALVNLGFFWIFAGVVFGYVAYVPVPQWSQPVLIFGLLITAFNIFTRTVLDKRFDWTRNLLTAQSARILNYGSLLLALVCAAILWLGGSPHNIMPLQLFIVAQLLWHSLAGSYAHGTALFMFVFSNILSLTAPGYGARSLPERLTVDLSLLPSLVFLLLIQVVHLLLEAAPGIRARAKALFLPFMIAATGFAAAAGLWACADVVAGGQMTMLHLSLVAALLILTGRAHASAPYLLLAATVGYLMTFAGAGQPPDTLLMPWRISVFALALAVASWLIVKATEAAPRLLTGAFPLPRLKATPHPWFLPVAMLLACASTVLQLTVPGWYSDPAQLPAPYISALALIFTGLIGRVSFVYAFATVVLTAGNIRLIDFYGSSYLLDHGLSHLHIACLGVTASLLQLTVLRPALAGYSAAVIRINRYRLALAAGVLGLIATNFVTAPDLDRIISLRFIISGGMALLAALYFRAAARRPAEGGQNVIKLCLALSHFGVSVFIWCLALLIPVLRQPQFTLPAFLLPGIWFWIRSEVLTTRDGEQIADSRNAAAIVGSAVLALYVFRTAFNMVFHPGQPLHFDYYHYNSICVIAAGLMLFRLRGLGGTNWLAFYGGLAIMTGGYFAITWFPGLSPSTNAVPAAWVAVLMAHFWIAASSLRSPVRTWLVGLGQLGAEEWIALRHAWGRILMVAAHIPIVWTLMLNSTDTYMVAPLLAGGASVLLHRALVTKSMLHFILAGIELTLALHTDFIVPSYLPKAHIVWVLLGAWAVLIATLELMRRRISGALPALLGCMAFAHILWHGPDSLTGLFAFAVLGILVALTPKSARAAGTQGETGVAFIPLAVPVWLVFFANGGSLLPTGQQVQQASILALLTAVVTAGAGRIFQERGAETYGRIARRQPRVLDQTLTWLAGHGRTLFTGCLWTVTPLAAFIQIAHYSTACNTVEMSGLCALYVLLLAGWYYEGQLRQTMSAYVFLQVCMVLLFVLVRRQLMLTFGFWTPEYDVWASLAASACLAAAKQTLDLRPAHMRQPFTFSLFALPVFALIWVVANGLDTNMALVVLGLQSVMYSYLGRDERESPCNAVAVGGYVAFMLLLLWSRFHIQVMFAYVVPVGIGVLFLVQLFAKRLDAGVRSFVRGAALLAMFGSVAYSVLIDNSHPLVFNMSMIGLGLVAMIAGTILRLRLVLAAGACGIVVDLITIFVRMVWHMDRGIQMTVIGSLILILGAGLVAGTVYYKTHREAFSAAFSSWLKRFGDWE